MATPNNTGNSAYAISGGVLQTNQGAHIFCQVRKKTIALHLV